jgi:cytochrome c oxidase subunit II
VFVLVLALFAAAARRSGRERPDRLAPPDLERSTRLVIGGGVVLPMVVLVPLTVMMLVVADRISSSDGRAGSDGILEIEVVGHQFWWEVRYPGSGTVTANEIHIPAGEPVRLVMGSADVIHSVWVPQLAGKIDMIPGQTTSLEIDADRPGEYLGYCAEFCGIQHARMRFLVIAHDAEGFAAWLAAEAAPARDPVSPTAERGLVRFAEYGCAACHTVRGTDATGELGPDLTHLASRRTLGAATRPNDRDELARWILDPHEVKPGNLMPPTPIGGDELDELLDYLGGLE